MKKATPEAYNQAWAMFEAKHAEAAIMEATGLNYSQMWRDRTRRQLEAGTLAGGFLAQPATLTEKAVTIARLRTAGESWGLISVRFNEPESRTRKAFEASGMSSQGLRIGKGGRYVADEPRFYTGTDRAALGSELEAAKPVLPQVPQDVNAAVVRQLPKLAKATVRKARKATARKAQTK